MKETESAPLKEKLGERIKSLDINALSFASTFAVLVIAYFSEGASNSLSTLQHIARIVIYLLCYFFLFIYLCGSKTTGSRLETGSVVFLSILTALYIISAAFLSRFLRNSQFFDTPALRVVLMPSAFFIMIIAIMQNLRFARIMSMLLPLGAFLSGAFDFSSYIFALLSGISSTFIIDAAEKRMDLVKSGCVVSLSNITAAGAILLLRGDTALVYMWIILLAAVNGITSSAFVLIVTPVLERILKTATNFRLIELLDMNTPIMRQLASKTPGTFNHSLEVANLAEAACQAIGANALLARVGAYYHDIGKIDQPDYFTENQHNGNKHDVLQNPRLSATIIRSHVKIGVEKGRAAGLPKAVIDIIASHHGNGVISYFRYAAQQKEGIVEDEDFRYHESPPRTKEAAVVMLADVTEAAVRSKLSASNDNPTAARLEAMINELINSVKDSQLREAELTFRELETIKKVFVRVLAGFYHSRIDYPKQKPAAQAAPAAQALQKGAESTQNE